jgi:hypothetical protein
MRAGNKGTGDWTKGLTEAGACGPLVPTPSQVSLGKHGSDSRSDGARFIGKGRRTRSWRAGVLYQGKMDGNFGRTAGAVEDPAPNRVRTP